MSFKRRSNTCKGAVAVAAWAVPQERKQEHSYESLHRPDLVEALPATGARLNHHKNGQELPQGEELFCSPRDHCQ
jgi:hypothetical protein